MVQTPPLQFPPALANDETDYLARISHDLQMLAYPPVAAAQNAAPQSIPASGVTRYSNVLTWPTVVLDPYGYWNARVPWRLTVPPACGGLHHVGVLCSYDGTADRNFTQEFGIVLVRLAHPNTPVIIAMDNRQAPAATEERDFVVKTPYPVAMGEGDYVFAYGWQTSPNPINTAVPFILPVFGIERVGGIPSTPGSFDALNGRQLDALTGTQLDALVGG